MTFNVEIVLRGRDFAVTDVVNIEHGLPAAWDEAAARDALKGILRAIYRAEHPSAPADPTVVLQGFSWIVEPSEGRVVIAIELPSGAAVAGPFDADQATLDALIARVLRTERQMAAPTTVH